MSKRLFAASGFSLATVRVFSPITQLGASGTRQPHSGHLVSVQYRKASARQPCSACSMPHSVTCASTAWNTAFCAERSSLATFSPPPTMLSALQVSSAATGFKSDDPLLDGLLRETRAEATAAAVRQILAQRGIACSPDFLVDRRRLQACGQEHAIAAALACESEADFVALLEGR